MIRKITRVEWSPSRGGFFEVLDCGHLGKQRRSKFLGSKMFGNGHKPSKIERNCPRCTLAAKF